MWKAEKNPVNNTAHYFPLDDLRPHVLEEGCWCQPEEDTEAAGLFKHFALDGREAYEQGTRKPS